MNTGKEGMGHVTGHGITLEVSGVHKQMLDVAKVIKRKPILEFGEEHVCKNWTSHVN